MSGENTKKQRVVSVDVGSGFTQFTDGNTEGCFPSLICPAPKDLGFGSGEAEIVNIAGVNYLVGKSAKAFGDPADRVYTLHDDWAGSTAWKVALYAAIVSVGVKNNDSINLITGLPQALYSEKGPGLVEEVGGQNTFIHNGNDYEININLDVIPQASGAIFHQASKEESILQDAVGVIDIGTYTTGFSVIEDGMPSAHRCGGCQVGVSVLSKALKDSIENDFGFKVDIARMPEILLNKKVRYRGELIDLTEHIERQATMVARPLLEKVSKLWTGGGDLLIFVAGGGAIYFEDAVKSVFPHAQVMSDSFYAVVRGMHTYRSLRGLK